MERKPLLLALGIVGLLGVGGYLTFQTAHASPVVARKQIQGPIEPADLTQITGLARSSDGRMLATVNDNKTVDLGARRNGFLPRLSHRITRCLSLPA